MLPPLHVLFCLLAVLNVAWALPGPRNHYPRGLLTPSLPSIVRRQATQNAPSGNTVTAATIVPLTLASDKA